MIVDEINVNMPAEMKCIVYQSKHTPYSASMSDTTKRIIRRNRFVLEVHIVSNGFTTVSHVSLVFSSDSIFHWAS